MTATKTKPKRTKVTPEHVSLAKQGYNPLISIHFKGLRRSDKVDLYDTYYERKNRAC